MREKREIEREREREREEGEERERGRERGRIPLIDRERVFSAFCSYAVIV